jgi:hypothetical protein
MVIVLKKAPLLKKHFCFPAERCCKNFSLEIKDERQEEDSLNSLFHHSGNQ